MSDSYNRKCKFCGRQIEISTAESGFRTNREFCSASCKTKDYRRRKGHAIALALKGKRANDIAKATNTRAETVRGWIAGAKTKVRSTKKGRS